MTVSRLFVSLVAAFLVFPTDALSCSCADNQGSVEWALKTAGIAEYVFLGRVEELPPQETSDKALTPDDLTVEVSVVELLKGALGLPTIQIYPGPGTCEMEFEIGNVYLIFAYASAFYESRYETSMCSSSIYEVGPSGTEHIEFLGDPPTSEELNTMLRASHDPILSALRRAYR